MRKIKIIVAVDENGGFGKDGKIPWNYPSDLKHFQKITKKSVCIMGKVTYLDIKNMQKKVTNSILPNRDCFVVSSTLTDITDATIMPHLSDAIEESDLSKDVFIIGGYRMFIQGMAFASEIHLTIIPGQYDCDRQFPISALTRGFTIESGTEKDGLKFLIYKRTNNFH